MPKIIAVEAQQENTTEEEANMSKPLPISPTATMLSEEVSMVPVSFCLICVFPFMPFMLHSIQ